MKENLYKYEKQLWQSNYINVAGCDEAGRGPLYGPVVCAAVILPHDFKLEGLNDSKKLSEKKREEYYPIIMQNALAVGISIVSAKDLFSKNCVASSTLNSPVFVRYFINCFIIFCFSSSCN